MNQSQYLSSSTRSRAAFIIPGFVSVLIFVGAPAKAFAYTPLFSLVSDSLIDAESIKSWASLICGSLFGLSLSGIGRAFRHSSGWRAIIKERRSAIPLAWYERAESIAHFGTYETSLWPNAMREETIWSDGMFRILGRSPLHGALRTDVYVASYVVPQDQLRVQRWFQQAFQVKGASSLEYRIRDEAGTIKHVSAYLEFVSTGSEESRFFGQIFDVTDREEAEASPIRTQSALQKSIATLDAIREEEQRRLARDMHDDLGQLLAAIKIDLCELERCLPPQDKRATERLESVRNLANSMSVSVRRIIADLPPQALDELNLLEAIGVLAANLEKRYDIACILALPQENPPISGRDAASIYRMIQEAFNNVARHAQASRVDLRIDTCPEKLTLSIADNGMGIPPAAQDKPDSRGLLGIRERAMALGGTMALSSCERTGTIILIEIPLLSGEIFHNANEQGMPILDDSKNIRLH